MKPHLCLSLMAVGLLSTGCTQDLRLMKSEYEAENRRLMNELKLTVEEVRILEQQRDDARMRAQRLEEQMKGMEVQLTGISTGRHISVAGDHISVDGLAFQSGSARLNEQAKVSLHNLAQQLNSGAYADKRLVVVGHTDSTPMNRAISVKTFGDNWGLSALRSTAVIRELIKSGITPKRISGGFKSQYAPVASNGSVEGRRQNRRVEIYLENISPYN